MRAGPGSAPDGSIPAGFVLTRIAGTSWMVRPAEAEALAASGAARLLEGRGRRAGGPGRGRGPITRLRIGARDAIGKRALHGGVLGGALGGVYLGKARLGKVVAAAGRLRAAGVHTPDVIAAGWRPVVGPLLALALITEEIAGGESLQEILLMPGLRPARRRALLRSAGATVRAMHAEGFRHADLNLANLVIESPAGGSRLHVVDLDAGWFVDDPEAARSAAGNLGRLMRSWEKWIEPRAPGRLGDLVAFLRGYSGDPAERRRLAIDLLRRRSGWRARRWLWKWRGQGGAPAPA